MDSWYFNKMAGAALAALLLAFGAGTLGDIVRGGYGDSHAKPGYVLPVTGAPAGGAVAAAAPTFKFADVAPLLKGASAESGQSVFAQCRSCHSVDKGGKTLQGPNLWGIVGHKVGTNASFPGYSPALKAKGGDWTFEALATYLNNPIGAIPGNRMGFGGIKNNGDLADLLAYLRTLADSPVAMPN